MYGVRRFYGSSPNCPDVLLEVGRQEPWPKGPQFDQGGPLGQGGLADHGHGSDIGEGGEEGQIVGNPPPLMIASLSRCVTLQSFWKIGQIGL